MTVDSDPAHRRGRTICSTSTREIADRELAPSAADFEARGEFPREVIRMLGRAGLLGLPYPEEYGGGGQPYEVYLQVLEILAGALAGHRRGGQRAHAVLLPGGRLRHRAAAQAAARHARRRAARRVLPVRAAGRLRRGGADHPGGARRRRRTWSTAPRRGSPTPAWPTSTTSSAAPADPARAASPACWPTPTRPGMLPQAPERTMGLRSSPVAQIAFDGARVPADRLIGDEGAGFRIAMRALDSGRLGIAACAVGLAQAALDYAAGYAREREQFGRPIIDFQGVGFMLADMATQISAARALTLARGPAARRRPAVLDRGGQGQAVRHRHGDAGDHRRRAGARRLRLRAPTTRSSGTCARPRCCRSSRAPTRSSAW